MKIIAITNNIVGSTGELTSMILPDSAIVKSGRPFFIPEFDDNFIMTPVVAIRISRLGKGIPERFAHRYYDSIAPAISVHAETVLKRAKENGDPWSNAWAFDNSIVIGEFLKPDTEKIPSCSAILNESEKFTWDSETMRILPDAIISFLSMRHTLKIGDLIIPSIPNIGIRIKSGDKVSLTSGESSATVLNIK